MTVVMPRLVQTPSPNFSSRNGAPIRLIVVHDTEGGYAGAVAWFSQPRSQVSAHLVMREDGGEVTQMVPLAAKAWHACAFNPVSIGIEGAGIEAHGFGDAWWRGMANIVAWLLHAYGLPPRWAQGSVVEGFCSHHDLGAAGGGHNDPCAVGSADWTRFVELVSVAYTLLGNGPLPPFALHGLPAPLAAHTPALVAAEPSHGGAPRAEPGDEATHATASGYPDGSIADLQWRLNRAGAKPALTVDGFYGPGTKEAVRAFQAGHGLYQDGLAGPMTRAALIRATG